MFKHYTAVILCDDMLEGHVGEGCSGEKGGIGSGLSKCSVHDVDLAGLAMEYFSYRR